MTRIAGIIAEYDPFHAGHAYHIEETKRLTGADGVICVMSGAFVQRGEPAFLDKYARAEAAVRGGADLVLELPPAFATASAEGFARGGVRLLEACGCVTDLSFGAETAELLQLQQAAALLSEPELLQEAKVFMKAGRSYAAALAAALRKKDPALADLIRTPNNMLAIEYLKALNHLGITDMKPLAVKRVGAAYHDTELMQESSFPGLKEKEDPAAKNYPSATAIRKAHFVSGGVKSEGPESEEGTDYTLALPPEAAGPLIMAKLRTLAYTGADLTEYEDVTADLASRIMAAAPFTMDYKALCEEVATRAFTVARVKRSLMHILLEIKKETSEKKPAYLKVLALRAGSRAVAAFAEKARLPRITKAADDREDLAADARFAQDLYHQMVCARHGVILPDDYRKSPFVLYP